MYSLQLCNQRYLRCNDRDAEGLEQAGRKTERPRSAPPEETRIVLPKDSDTKALVFFDITPQLMTFSQCVYQFKVLFWGTDCYLTSVNKGGAEIHKLCNKAIAARYTAQT